jgi:hypothetical protein
MDYLTIEYDLTWTKGSHTYVMEQLSSHEPKIQKAFRGHYQYKY